MIKHYLTAKHTKERLSLQEPLNKDVSLSLNYDKAKTFQSILGFGGAFTEAAAYTFYQMPSNLQKEVLDAYFNQTTGLRYNLGRVSIHSCDFSLDNYTYIEDGDEELDSFDISRDLKYVVPMINRAELVRSDKMNILASPWSPPAWMKSNKDMNHGGYLLDKYKDAWSSYYIKFLEAYKNNDINVFAITVQNEPAAKQVWDSCIYSAEEEKDFVRDYLGPKIKASSYKDTKILIWDHNRDVIVDRVKPAFNDKEASKYIWGTGFHWYVSEAFENLSKVHELAPDKHILFTEGTIEGGVQLGAFESGERYARNMIGDFSNYCEGYIDWNLMLNEEGGPNHVGNFCDAPIIYDRFDQKIYYNYSYDAIGHFSKFVDVGALRIESVINSDDLKSVGFINPDGSLVFIILNETEKQHYLDVGSNTFDIKARSISTIIIEGE
jgi:glucosylceramidase